MRLLNATHKKLVSELLSLGWAVFVVGSGWWLIVTDRKCV
jgi:hypothetical protein